MHSLKLIIATLFVAAVLTACTKKPGHDFIGSWTAEGDDGVMTIERNGETFAVDMDGEQLIFVYSDGQLKFEPNGPQFGGVLLTYLESSDQIRFEMTGSMAAMGQLEGQPTQMTLNRQ